MQFDQATYGNYYPVFNPVLYPWDLIVSKEKSQKRVLIIDDDQDLLELFKYIFKNDKKIKIHTAQDPYEAMDMLSAQVFDYIVLDWNLPNLNGFETLKEVEKGFKFDPNLPLEWDNKRVKVIVLSGNEKDDCKVINSKHFRYSGYIKKTNNIASIVNDLRKQIKTSA